MPCYRPVTAFKPLDGGPVLFSEVKGCREIQLPCGRCIGCRLARQDEWATRCVLESKLHKHNHFITFTYNEDSLPWDNGLHYRHVQLLHKKMRQKFGPFRFFVAGEYGDDSKRPHYHGLYFGLDLPDLVKCNSVYASADVYNSESLGKLWPQGFHTIGEVNYSTARYCAAYAVKKVNGDLSDAHYERVHLITGEIVKVEPEFARMSTNPGIGERWIRKYWPEVYVSGHAGIALEGKLKPIPRYFDKVMSKLEKEEVLEEHKFKQIEKVRSENHTRERLKVRETCTRARQRMYKERKANAL